MLTQLPDSNHFDQGGLELSMNVGIGTIGVKPSTRGFSEDAFLKLAIKTIAFKRFL